MMLAAWVMDIILLIAPQYDVPPYLVAAIIIVESRGNPYAINSNNANGTIDRGIMQLNSSWFNCEDWSCPETNITAGVSHLQWLYQETKIVSPTWWAAVVAYNCGLSRFQSSRGAPQASINYANEVFRIWNHLDSARARMYGVN